MSTIVIDIVCHDVGLLDMLDMSLSSEGYLVNPHIASATGHDMIEEPTPALRIVEVRPDRAEDNRRLWDTVRSDPKAHIPVIAITNPVMADSEQGSLLEAFADDVLPLLFDLDELLDRVHKTLSSSVPSCDGEHVDQFIQCDSPNEVVVRREG